MKKEWITAAGAAALGAALFCTGSIFAPLECRAEDTAQAGQVFEVEESGSEDYVTAGNTSTTGSFGRNGGIRWQYNESTKTVTVTGEDKIIFNGIIQTYGGSVNGIEVNEKTMFNKNAEHIVFKNCYMPEADLSGMFAWLPELKDIDFSGLEVGKITGLDYMFYHCENVERLDLSWLTNIEFGSAYMCDGGGTRRMFDYCGVEYLNISTLPKNSIPSLTSCGSLKILETPKDIPDGTDIELPKSFTDDAGNRYTTMSSANAGMTLKSRDCNGWSVKNSQYYWYEDGIRQGREGRGKEIFDPDSDAWYWLDAVQDGAKAVSKDVYQESSGGKWVRYDADGHMIKGWSDAENGKYYFDPITGAMTKGLREIDGVRWFFDETTGIAYDNTWVVEGDKYYWYEKGFKQGTEGRGKEIYDAKSDGWYWLDAIQGGAKAVSKDVYQESSGGKWVRYDADGHMVKGWQQTNAGTYYFDRITGAMSKGWINVEGRNYYFDEATGRLQA